MDDDILAAWHNAMAAMGAVPVTVDYSTTPLRQRQGHHHTIHAKILSGVVEVNIKTTTHDPTAPYTTVTHITVANVVTAGAYSQPTINDSIRAAFRRARLCLRCAHLLEQHTVGDDNGVRCHCGCGSFKS